MEFVKIKLSLNIRKKINQKAKLIEFLKEKTEIKTKKPTTQLKEEKKPKSRAERLIAKAEKKNAQ